MIESKIGLRREEGETREGRGGEGTGVVLAGPTGLLAGNTAHGRGPSLKKEGQSFVPLVGQSRHRLLPWEGGEEP